MSADLTARRDDLHDRLAGYGSLAVAFSGGVDSTFLLAAAVDALGDRAVGVTAVSPSLADAERDEARRLARDLGARHLEVATDEVERAAYRVNDLDRCFHCKSALFDVLEPLAAVEGFARIALGVITDDLGDHRPGQRAAAQRGVVTPLADAGLSKADVRELSRQRGLPTHDKPAAACLASRVAYGLPVDAERLVRIGTAEAYLRARLPRTANLRVRDHGEVARIEVDPEHLHRVRDLGDDLTAHLTALGWTDVHLDLDGFRSGSMNGGHRGRRVLPLA